jgi:hypothetical protein
MSHIKAHTSNKFRENLALHVTFKAHIIAHLTNLLFSWHFLFDITFHIKITNKTLFGTGPYVLLAKFKKTHNMLAFYTFILKTPLWRSFIGHLYKFIKITSKHLFLVTNPILNSTSLV